MVHRTVKLGDPRLRILSKPVATFDADLKTLADDMTATMFKENGVGLAAPQVGKNVRLAIVRFGTDEKKERVFAMANPEIIARSEETETMEEGCLSIPGIFGPVTRTLRLTLRYQDLAGAAHEEEVAGFDARIVQHEIDHLDGTLYIDRVGDKTRLIEVKRSR